MVLKCYIRCKDRTTKKKILWFSKGKDKFTWMGYDYNIDPRKVYKLGLFRCLDYIQNVPDPLDLYKVDYKPEDISVSSAVRIINGLLSGIPHFEEIMVLCMLGLFVICGIILYKIMEIMPLLGG